MLCSNGLSPLPAAHPTGHAMTGCGPPANVSPPSPWPRVDHNSFGSYMSDLGIFMPCASLRARTRFHFDIILPLTYTPWLLLQEEGQNTGIMCRSYLSIFHFHMHKPFHALSSCNHLVSDLFAPTRVGAFQLSFALLVHYRSLVNI